MLDLFTTLNDDRRYAIEEDVARCRKYHERVAHITALFNLRTTVYNESIASLDECISLADGPP
jgi:hypothetical protein